MSLRTLALRHFTLGVFFILLYAACNVVSAESTAATLTGRVSSAAESSMEGVLVSARKDGSNITYTVVSDARGRFDFAAAKLDAGRYSLQIRAVGYDLDGPSAVDIPPPAPST